MKKYLVRMIAALSIVAVALTFASVVRAQETNAKPAKVKAVRHELTGGITAVDAKAGTLSVKKGEETMTFQVSAKCKVVLTGKEGSTVADLKVGDKVTVRYTEEGAAKVAHWVGSPPVAKAKTTAPAAAPTAP